MDLVIIFNISDCINFNLLKKNLYYLLSIIIFLFWKIEIFIGGFGNDDLR